MRRRLRAKERDRAFLLAWLLRRKPEGAQPARAELPRVRGHLARAFSRAPASALQPAVRLGDAATEDAGRGTVRLEDLAGPACEHCGAPIPEGKRIDAAFCSRRCATKSHHAAESLALAEARSGRTCPECGGPVVAKNITQTVLLGVMSQRGILAATAGRGAGTGLPDLRRSVPPAIRLHRRNRQDVLEAVRRDHGPPCYLRCYLRKFSAWRCSGYLVDFVGSGGGT